MRQIAKTDGIIDVTFCVAPVLGHRDTVKDRSVYRPCCQIRGPQLHTRTVQFPVLHVISNPDCAHVPEYADHRAVAETRQAAETLQQVLQAPPAPSPGQQVPAHRPQALRQGVL